MDLMHYNLGTLAALSLLAAGCGGGSGLDVNEKPSYVGTVTTTSYDGNTDDLLTAGLGASGLASAVAPSYVDQLAPTAAELRRAAIYNNYRAIVDMTAGGGYGSLYGPNVDVNNVATTGEGKVAGTETIAYSDDGSGKQNVTLMIQVPASFDVNAPCIVTATSSGSRGAYGAISTGEWGLKRGCVVAYTDKGTGGAPHDLQSDTVARIDGTRGTSAAVATAAHFRADLSTAELSAFNTASPNRFAFKHAHSQRNPEKDWGLYTRQAVEFALFVLNERYGEQIGGTLRTRRFKPENTIVIASSVSNGGGAAIAAAEGDEGGLIDAVVVSEPQVQLSGTAAIAIRRGANNISTFGRPLYDYASHANLYGQCAALSAQLAGTPFQGVYATGFGFFAANRCASLRAKGLLAATTTAAQADEALAAMRNYGWEPESVAQYATFAGFEVAGAVTLTYANAFARASAKDNLCGYSFASTTQAGVVDTLVPATLAQLFAIGNGIPPANGIQLVNNANPGAALRDLFSFSPSTTLQDMNLDGALCLRGLLTGTGASATALQAGQAQTFRNGNLRGKPALIVHGRDDGLLPVNHTSRAYTALNKTVEGGASRLSYIEVTNAQHFDTFIGLPTVLPGFDSRYIPLHVYLFRALDAMVAHLRAGTALPPSQVVRTVARGGTPGAAPAITAANVPPIAATPSTADAITISGNTLVVPD